ncbi:SOS response-associated peptidase [Tersicoccus sp. MR15.9]|uniref:SOS response-associated peptidase n=1 Tax=Tersicoccus mangrovi TaxID=3121635 RepID=UPI002FE53976
MCGRFAMDKDVDDLIQAFVADGGRAQDWRPTFSMAPTMVAPLVREHRGRDGELKRELEPASWGFVPGWGKPGGRAPINARLETVATNGLFKRAFAGARAIVPMSGYFEWEQRDDGKQPFYLHGPDGASGLLAAAAVGAARKDGDDWAISFAIITREARDASGEVHDRMPVFLAPETWERWLDPEPVEGKAADELVQLLEHTSSAVASTVTHYPVDRKVNSTRTVDPEDPTLIQPLEETE